MDIINLALKEVKDIYNIYILLLALAIGLYTFFYEGGRLKKSGPKRDELFARSLGVIYTVFSLVLYIVVLYV